MGQEYTLMVCLYVIPMEKNNPLQSCVSSLWTAGGFGSETWVLTFDAMSLRLVFIWRSLPWMWKPEILHWRMQSRCLCLCQTEKCLRPVFGNANVQIILRIQIQQENPTWLTPVFLSIPAIPMEGNFCLRVDWLVTEHLSTQERLDPRRGLCCFWCPNKSWTPSS
jgi:hypothetical protein